MMKDGKSFGLKRTPQLQSSERPENGKLENEFVAGA